jgi:hypothetical protein
VVEVEASPVNCLAQVEWRAVVTRPVRTALAGYDSKLLVRTRLVTPRAATKKAEQANR